jgi:hypothetical protein
MGPAPNSPAPAKLTSKELALKAGRRLARPAPGDEICITGIAGVFPDSTDVRDFGEKLNNKVDLISDDDRRWKLGKGIPLCEHTAEGKASVASPAK